MSRFTPQPSADPEAENKLRLYVEEITKAVALAKKHEKPFRLTSVAAMIGPTCDGHLLLEAWQRFSTAGARRGQS